MKWDPKDQITMFDLMPNSVEDNKNKGVTEMKTTYKELAKKIIEENNLTIFSINKLVKALEDEAKEKEAILAEAAEGNGEKDGN